MKPSFIDWGYVENVHESLSTYNITHIVIIDMVLILASAFCISLFYYLGAEEPSLVVVLQEIVLIEASFDNGIAKLLRAIQWTSCA